MARRNLRWGTSLEMAEDNYDLDLLCPGGGVGGLVGWIQVRPSEPHITAHLTVRTRRETDTIEPDDPFDTLEEAKAWLTAIATLGD